MNQETKLSSEQHISIIRDWQNCPPGELSNLFYFVNSKGTLQRYGVFKVGADAIDELICLGPDAIQSIRIDMGCGNNGKFTPVFTIVPKEGSPLHYKLNHQSTEETEQGGLKLCIISHAVSDLFRKKWSELNDEAMTQAFSGVTCDSIETSGKEIKVVEKYHGTFDAHRVKSYEFVHEDAKRIVANLIAVQGPDAPPSIEMYLGAGLTVDITHPFSFRPILSVSSKTKPMNPGPPNGRYFADGTYKTDYERSQPCPPYCK